MRFFFSKKKLGRFNLLPSGYNCLHLIKFAPTLIILIWGRCNLKRSRRTVFFLPVYKISSLKITPPKIPNSEQFSYPLPNIVSFLCRLEFQFRSRDFLKNSFPVWQPYCWRFWSAIVIHIHTSTINAPELRERIKVSQTKNVYYFKHVKYKIVSFFKFLKQKK